MNQILRSSLLLVALVTGMALGAASVQWQKEKPETILPKSNSKLPAETAVRIHRTEHQPEDGADAKVSLLLAAIYHPEDRFRGRVELCRALEQTGVSEIPDLLSRVQKLPPLYRKELTAALMERWFEADKDGAEQWLRANGGNSNQLAEIWARFAPDAALRAMMASSHTFWGAPSTALSQLAGNNRQARLAILAALPPSENRARAAGGEILNLAGTDPSAALQAAETFLSGANRKSFETIVLSTWAKKDPAAAASVAIEKYSTAKAGLFGDPLMTRLTNIMAEKDPKIAMDFAMSLREDLREYPLMSAAAGWAKTDPAAALAWSYENGIDLSGQPLTGTYYWGKSILTESIAADPDATIKWLLTLPQDAASDQLLAEAYKEQLKKAAPASLLTASNSSLDTLYSQLSPDAQRSLAGEIGARVAKGGAFPDLNAWTARFGDGPARAAAISGAIGAIFGAAPARVDSIIATLPTGPDRDQALATIATRERVSNPSGAAQHALFIADADTRRDILDDAIPLWLTQDGDACRAWLAGNKDIPKDWTDAWLRKK